MMYQTSDNSQLLRRILWINTQLTIFWSLKHHSTQPIYIFNRENPQNSESPNCPRWGLDFIALPVGVSATPAEASFIFALPTTALAAAAADTSKSSVNTLNLNGTTWAERKNGDWIYCKCFTCVTKTIANLTTYSRKPGDYNGTIIFEIDIMKNSSPLNLIFTFFAMSKPK